MFSSYLCLAAILRKQWVDHERLSFPLVQLPLEMVREETAGPFIRNKLAWIGFAIPAAVFGLNGLHTFYPALPQVSLIHDFAQDFPPYRPWNGMYYPAAHMSFAATGFGYLLPMDVLFSLWFFFLFNRAQDVVANALGMRIESMPVHSTWTIQGYQSMGAYLVMTFYLLRTSWPHLRRVARKALYDDPTVDDSRELMSYRTAFFGLLLSLLGAMAWCRAAGMSWWVAALEMVVYLFVIVIVMGRAVAEGGLLMTSTSFRAMDLFSIARPRSALGAANITGLTFIDCVFARDPRGLLFTGFMDGLRISDGVQLRRGSLLWAFVIAIPAAMLVAGAMHMWLPYHRGGLTLYSYPYQVQAALGFRVNADAAGGSGRFDWYAPSFFLAGGLFCAFLAFMRASFVWWPLHPLGYAVQASWGMIVLWFPCLAAWTLKGAILRWGGMRLYRTLRPLFLGLVLGEFTSAVMWTVVSMVTGSPAPPFPWP